MVGLSGQVGAMDYPETSAATDVDGDNGPCYCLATTCDVPFTTRRCKGCEDGAGTKITCEEQCGTPLSKKGWGYVPGFLSPDIAKARTRSPVNQVLTKQSFTSIVEKKNHESKERIKRLKKEFGYKDIKMGMLPVDIDALGVCDGTTCYSKQNWAFYFTYGEDENGCNSGLNDIFIDVGPYSSDFHNELLGKLRKKYEMSINGMTDRNIELYNAGEIGTLDVVFNDGAVSLAIYRRDDGSHRLAIWYLDEVQAKLFLEESQPQDDEF